MLDQIESLSLRAETSGEQSIIRTRHGDWGTTGTLSSLVQQRGRQAWGFGTIAIRPENASSSALRTTGARRHTRSSTRSRT